MKTLTVAFAVLSMVAYGSAYAAPRSAAPAAPAVAPPPSYCPDANTLVRIGGYLKDVVEQIHKTCQPGARVVFPAEATGVIMMACDPNKLMTPLGREITCTLAR